MKKWLNGVLAAFITALIVGLIIALPFIIAGIGMLCVFGVVWLILEHDNPSDSESQ